jgi:multimeric flavodoxin WrbA
MLNQLRTNKTHINKKYFKFLKTLDHYDLIIIGSPVWSDGITPAIRTFIAKNELSGKQVAIFNNS